MNCMFPNLLVLVIYGFVDSYCDPRAQKVDYYSITQPFPENRSCSVGTGSFLGRPDSGRPSKFCFDQC
jgi:hypothetical protein